MHMRFEAPCAIRLDAPMRYERGITPNGDIVNRFIDAGANVVVEIVTDRPSQDRLLAAMRGIQIAGNAGNDGLGVEHDIDQE